MKRSAFCIVVAFVETRNLWFTEALKLTYPSKDLCGLTVVIMRCRFLFHSSLDYVHQLYASVSQSVFRQLSSLWQYRAVPCDVLILRGNVSWAHGWSNIRFQIAVKRCEDDIPSAAPVSRRECLIPTVQVAMHNSEGLISSCRLSRFNASISYCSILVNFFREATSLL